MRRYLIAGLALGLVAMGSGCASVVRGTTEKVVINAVPADATIRTSLGHNCPTGPCTVEVSRKTEFTAFAEKPGYKPGSLYIATKMSGEGGVGLAGNVLIGGVIGVGVDAMSGATLDHYPNPATIMLVAEGEPGESSKAVPPPKPKSPNTAQRPGS